MNFGSVSFEQSVFIVRSLPEPALPEIAFAGRSNVGKSSLINCLVGRRALVKTSARPGKTQSLNFFVVDGQLRLVDLPGYGYAKVSHAQRASWQGLINGYLEQRSCLACVVVIVDLRHELKEQDRVLVEWLRHLGRRLVVVYTKADKLSANEQARHAAALDAGFNLPAGERILFSAKTGLGRDKLQAVLASYAQRC